MAGRKYTTENRYRYGFNGKENDSEVKGEGNQQDYGMRIFDSRLGRFLSVDPLTKEYPWYTPYSFAGNKPIEAIDLDGAEEYYINEKSRLMYQIDLHYRVEKETPEIVAYRNETILRADIYGGGHIGPRWLIEQKVHSITAQYNKAVGENIRGGIFGAAGYLIGGDELSFKGAVLDNAATAVVALQKPTETLSIVASQKQASMANKNTSVTKPNTGKYKTTPTLQQKRETSITSEAIVRSKLKGELAADEILMEKPRFYINDGKNWTTPDFAIYNTTTHQFVRIPDAKNGGADLRKGQNTLNTQGGEFRGSSRYPEAQPQSIRPGLVTKEKTTLPYSN